MALVSEFPIIQAAKGEPVTYHNGNTKDKARYKDGRPKPPDMIDRTVIAWDMEGMNLSGDDKPQHPVIFGCSIEPENVLIGKRLSSMEMLNYIIDVGQRYPNAIHVGYGFRYDANMLLQDFSVAAIRILYEKNRVKVRHFDKATQETWYLTLHYLPGKRLTITRCDNPKPARKNRHNPKRTSVTIEDYSSFFGTAFIKTAENILKDDLTESDRETISHGKAERGSNEWSDLAEVRYYWEREIQLISKTFRKFRDVMYQAGFKLRSWYGPGALANYINTTHGIRPALVGAQVTSGIMPPEVHEASKVAFAGGRFEAFQLGRTKGPIHAVDINSAYPYALTMIPSLEHGEWKHETRPAHIRRFGIYKIEYQAPKAHAIDQRPMPLFWRDKRGMISYPNRVSGWYMSPEARIVQSMPGVNITEGWYWDSDETVMPWTFLHDMYETRQRLGKENLLSMPFKLGPNSLYGKYAQTVGWDEENMLPPKSHCLPVAAWVTSYCRAMLWSAMSNALDRIIAVETDSIYTTAEPHELGITLGDGLGQWSHDTYDEIAYLQSGMYLTKKDGEWSGVRSRGIARAEFDSDGISQYLRGLVPGEQWEPYRITTKPRFVGMGASFATNSPFKDTHCTWQPQIKDITFGDTGKRRHHQSACAACNAGMTPWDGPHRTVVHSKSDGYAVSQPRRLPWEQAHTEEVQSIRDNIKLEGELINV